MGRGRHGLTNQSLVKGNNLPVEIVVVKKTKSKPKNVVNINPELIKLLKDTNPALLVNFLTH